MLQFAKENGDVLIVGVYSDELSGNGALVSEHKRLNAVKKFSCVDHGFIIDEQIETIIKYLKPDVIVKGKEFELEYNSELAELERYGGRLIFSSGESFTDVNDSVEKNDVTDNFLRNAHYLERHSIEIENLKKTISSFCGKKVLIIGDVILDEYISCKAEGMSREEPVIVVAPGQRKNYIGGSCIVAAHAASLGSEVHFISVLGSDKEGEYIETELKGMGVECAFHIDHSRPTTKKKI